MAAGGTTSGNAGWVMPNYMKTAAVGSASLMPARVGISNLSVHNHFREAFKAEASRKRMERLVDLFNTPHIDRQLRFMDPLDLGMVAFYSLYLTRLQLNRVKDPRNIKALGFQAKYDLIMEYLNKILRAKDVKEAYLHRIVDYMTNEGIPETDIIASKVLVPLFTHFSMKGGRRKTKKLNKRRRKYTRK
jgi:hypothetical protein